MGKKDKLFDKFLQKPPKKDLTFDELEIVLIGLGYKKITGSGSRVKFYHKTNDILINLHKPHPDPTLKMYVIKMVQNKLQELNYE
jgi:hypothetical protein